MRAAMGAGNVPEGGSLSGEFAEWITSSLMVVALMLGVGKFILGFYMPAVIWLSIALACWMFIRKRLALIE